MQVIGRVGRRSRTGQDVHALPVVGPSSSRMHPRRRLGRWRPPGFTAEDDRVVRARSRRPSIAGKRCSNPRPRRLATAWCCWLRAHVSYDDCAGCPHPCPSRSGLRLPIESNGHPRSPARSSPGSHGGRSGRDRNRRKLPTLARLGGARSPVRWWTAKSCAWVVRFLRNMPFEELQVQRARSCIRITSPGPSTTWASFESVRKRGCGEKVPPAIDWDMGRPEAAR